MGIRITPAHAGNTQGMRLYITTLGDHPRTCGEHDINPNEAKYEQGSPPHMRGTRPPSENYAEGHGITPAHAGNTQLLDKL